MNSPRDRDVGSSYQPNGSRELSRAFTPIGLVLGLGLAVGGVILIAWAAQSHDAAKYIPAGIVVTSWGLHFLLGFGTLVYYLARRPEIARRESAGLPTTISATDIDDYDVPLRNSITARFTLGMFTAGGHNETPLIRTTRALTILNYVVFIGAILWFIVAINAK